MANTNTWLITYSQDFSEERKIEQLPYKSADTAKSKWEHLYTNYYCDGKFSLLNLYVLTWDDQGNLISSVQLRRDAKPIKKIRRYNVKKELA